MPTRGIPFPTGDPTLPPAQEREWRRQLMERALQALTTAVPGPTVFEVEGNGDGDGGGD